MLANCLLKYPKMRQISDFLIYDQIKFLPDCLQVTGSYLGYFL